MKQALKYEKLEHKGISKNANLILSLKTVMFIITLLFLLNILLSPAHATMINQSSYLDNRVFENNNIPLFAQDRMKQNMHEVSRLLMKKNYQGAIYRLEAIKKKGSYTVQQCYLMSLAYVGLERWQQANVVVDECIAIDDQWPEIYGLKGTVLFTLGKHIEASRQYDTVVSLSPESPASYLQRAKFHFANQKNDKNALKKALIDIEIYKQKQGDENNVLALQGLIYSSLGQEHKAIAYLNRAVNIEPDNLMLLEKLLPLYYKIKATNKAQIVLNKSLQSIAPKENYKLSHIYLLLARHTVIVKQTEPTERNFKLALQALPSNKAALKEFIYWLDKQERLNETIILSQQGLQYYTDDAFFTAYMAWALADEGTNLWQAQMWLQKAKKLAPKNVYLSDTQAWLSVRQKQYKQALKDIQPSLIYAKQVPEIAYHAGVIFSELGKYEEAVKYLQLSLLSTSSFTGKTQAKALLAKLRH